MRWQGQKIDGRFELCEYLGGSQDRAVFLTNLNSASAQRAAIKLIKADAKSTESQLSIWSSIKDLSHPHIIRLFGIGEHTVGEEHWPYVVMECAEENLSTILSYRPLTAKETHEMLGPMLDALAYLHAQGFVHGRIKPSNIMVVDEQVKISSDGIMRTGQPNDDLAGPSHYLPPEAASGRAIPSVDVWSLGVTLVEALTQEKLGSLSAREREAILYKLPSPFGNIAEQCLRSEPEQRCTIADIQNELGRSALPVRSSGGDRPDMAIKHSRLFGPVAIVVLLSTMLAGVLLFKHRESKSAISANTIQSQAPSPANLPAETKIVANSDAVGKVVRPVLPDVSRSSLRTIHGIVRVKVRVYIDEAGIVQRAQIESPGFPQRIRPAPNPTSRIAGRCAHRARRLPHGCA
ncbi:MAG: serine/threonine kinase [Acidobacteriaceae bacterium]|nr:serine/threonine kinase [Acidobacteriaceae bacterium]